MQLGEYYQSPPKAEQLERVKNAAMDIKHSGRWRLDDKNPRRVILFRTLVGSYQEDASMTVVEDTNEVFAEFFASLSPEIALKLVVQAYRAQQLAEENEGLKADVEQHAAAADATWSAFWNAGKYIEDLKEALMFYAKADYYVESDGADWVYPNEITQDEGEVACRALGLPIPEKQNG